MKEYSETPEIFNAIVNNSDAGIVYYSCIRDEHNNIIDFRYEFINDRALLVLPHLVKEYIGTTMLSHYPDRKEASWFDVFKEVAETGITRNITVSTIIENKVKWFRDKAVKYGDGLILYFYDETEKLKISNELEDKNKELQKLLGTKSDIFSEVLNQAFDGVLYLMPVHGEHGELSDFRIIFMNESALRSLKLTHQDIYPFTFIQVFPNTKENGTFQMYTEAYKNGTSSRRLVSYNDGRIGGWYRVDTFKYEDGVVVYFRDETSNIEHEKKIEQQNKDLQSLLKQKEILLQETHHRVKNNMQVIASLLNLQARSVTDPLALEAFQISIQRIKTMAMIHEKLYRERNFETMPFEGFVSDVISSIRGFYDYNKDIQFKYIIEDVNLPISTCINLGLILNELFSNSIKYAFADKDSGEICVESKVKDNKLELIIKDNGPGFPADIDLNNLSSLGLTIIQVLVEQMDGSLKIESRDGAVFHISLPLKEVQEGAEVL